MSATTMRGPYTIGEAARILGVHPGSLRRAERMGRLPPAKREGLTQTRMYFESGIELLRALVRHRAVKRRPE